MNIYLCDRLAIGKLAIALALLATPALAYDYHRPLRDDGTRWAATSTPTQMQKPTEDQGVDVIMHGVISEAALVQQFGLVGQVLRMSTVILAPGGQIAANGVASGPGFLVVTSGEWTEGAQDFERVHTTLVSPTLTTGLRETWYFNQGATPAVALVIEIISRAELDVAG